MGSTIKDILSKKGDEFMAYNELMKNFVGIRNYMRQFLVYGFRSRGEFDNKSARSYDNEKRRVESWLSDYMAFHQDANGKAIFLSVDSRHIPHNPLHKGWKASCFTKNDISLHFLLLDILAEGKALSIPEILDCIDVEYMAAFPYAEPIDESTLRKKLKEYVKLGLIASEKQGKQLVYYLSESRVDLAAWQEAITFFSEQNALGVVGSYLLDKFPAAPNFLSFKHRYLMFTLDSGIILDLLTAIRAQREIELELVGGRNGHIQRYVVLPLSIYISVQGGRQYLVAYNLRGKKVCFFRLDNIQKVKPLEIVENYQTYQESLKDVQPHIWGVATGQYTIEHIEMMLSVAPKDIHIAQRLQREKRVGRVEQLDETTWRFSADVYDTRELLPWLRTFIGRIISLTCTNQKVEEQFWEDLSALADQYGGDDHVV